MFETNYLELVWDVIFGRKWVKRQLYASTIVPTRRPQRNPRYTVCISVLIDPYTIEKLAGRYSELGTSFVGSAAEHEPNQGSPASVV